MNNNPSTLRTGVRGAAIGVAALTASLVGLGAAAGASDVADTEPVEAPTSVEVPADAEVLDADITDEVTFDFGDDVPEGEWHEAEKFDGEIPADAEIIELTDGDVEEYDLGDIDLDELSDGEFLVAELVEDGEIPADAEIIELTEDDLVEFGFDAADLEDLGDGEWIVAEAFDGEIPADAEIVELTDGDIEEYELD